MTHSNKSAIITGAAGFLGYHLTKALSDAGICVYAIVRPGSQHDARIKDLPGVVCVEFDVGIDGEIPLQISKPCDFFFHLAWSSADRYDYAAQMENAYTTLRMLEASARLECRRFIGIGSQAEYGITTEIIREDQTPPSPFCGYGAAKVAACYLTKRRAQELGIEWVWGRIFSVYGRYEPAQRVIPYIMDSLKSGKDISLSSCRQNWDFLYGADAGEALLAMAENGRNGAIYNIADGRYRPLREYVEEMIGIYGSKARFFYGEDPKPFVSLQPSIAKLQRDTGWYPKVSFEQGIRTLMREQDET